MHLVFLGLPGVGKGTVAAEVSKKKKICHISTGEVLRAEVKEKTDLGLKARRYIVKGKLVPDHLAIQIVEDRTRDADCARGFLLDGFPRTIRQAKYLDADGADIDHVIYLSAKISTIVKRIAGRRTCKKCGDIYNIYTRPPKKENICDDCGHELWHRPDDKPEAVRERLKIYQDRTKPLVDFYKEKGLCKKIDAERDVPDIVADVIKEIS